MGAEMNNDEEIIPTLGRGYPDTYSIVKPAWWNSIEHPEALPALLDAVETWRTGRLSDGLLQGAVLQAFQAIGYKGKA